MPVFFANPSRVVIYSDGDTSPETASPPNLARVKFDTDLDYVRIVRENTVPLNLPALGRQASGNENPAYFQNHVLESHGLGYTPLVFGFATISGVHIPLRGSVPIQSSAIGAQTGRFGRFLSLGSSATQIILNEYAVRNFFAVPGTPFPAVTVVVTYFITEEAL